MRPLRISVDFHGTTRAVSLPAHSLAWVIHARPALSPSPHRVVLPRRPHVRGVLWSPFGGLLLTIPAPGVR